MSVRREEIIEVAKAMFAEQGVRQTTVRQIGARAGILSGSLYHHFDSKVDIVDAILSEFCESVLAEYRCMAAAEPDGLARLRLMTRYAYALTTDHRAAIVIIQNDSEELTHDDRFAYLVAFNDEVERRWVTTIRDAMKAGQLRADLDPRLLYRFVRDAILGSIVWYRPSKGKSIRAIADSLLDVVLVGVAVPAD